MREKLVLKHHLNYFGQIILILKGDLDVVSIGLCNYGI